MPNWCEGTIKFRGKKEDLLKLLNEKVVYQNYEKNPEGGLPLLKETNIKFELDKHGEEILWNKEILNKKTIRLIGVRRLFITMPDYIELYENKNQVLILDCQIAWGIIPDGRKNYLKIAKEYNLDLRFKGYECGGEFEQLFEIINDEITKYEEITYDDYEWECDFPKMGG